MAYNFLFVHPADAGGKESTKRCECHKGMANYRCITGSCQTAYYSLTDRNLIERLATENGIECNAGEFSTAIYKPSRLPLSEGTS